MQQQTTKPLCWMSSTQSGLGDRLINTAYMLTLARKMGLALHMEWKGYDPPAGKVPEYRSQDILIENLSRHIQFPNDLVIVSDRHFPVTNNGMDCTIYGGFSINSCDFYERIGNKHFASLSEFQNLLALSAHDFKFIGVSEAIRKMIPNDTASIHIRRTDKVCPNPDVYMIHEDELNNLNKLTERWILNAGKEHQNFYICGDDSDEVVRYQDFIRRNGLSVIDPTVGQNIHDWERTYIDLAVMSASKTIFQSQKNSSFSRFAAMLCGAKMVNAYDGESVCI